MKKTITLMLVLALICVGVVMAETTMNFLTKGFADTLYCQVGGDCVMGNITVSGINLFNGSINFINVTIVNYNVTGLVNVEGNISADCMTLLDGTTFCNSYSAGLWENSTGEIKPKSSQNISTTKWFKGLFNWTVTSLNSFINPTFDGSLLTLDFNDELLNETIDAKLDTEFFNATQIDTVAGTVDAGDIDSLSGFGDGNSYNISELNNQDFIIYVNWTGITDFNNLNLRYWYDATDDKAHHIHTCLWDFIRSDWDCEYTEIEYSSHFVIGVSEVFDAPSHIGTGADSGKVLMGLFHDSEGDKGRISHKFYLDYATLSLGFTGFVPTGVPSLQSVVNAGNILNGNSNIISKSNSTWDNVFVNESVGIGTANPTVALDVNGTTKTTILNTSTITSPTGLINYGSNNMNGSGNLQLDGEGAFGTLVVNDGAIFNAGHLNSDGIHLFGHTGATDTGSRINLYNNGSEIIDGYIIMNADDNVVFNDAIISGSNKGNFAIDVTNGNVVSQGNFTTPEEGTFGTLLVDLNPSGTPEAPFQVISGIHGDAMIPGNTTGISQALTFNHSGWGTYWGINANTGMGWVQQGRTNTNITYDYGIQMSGGNLMIGAVAIPATKVEMRGDAGDNENMTLRLSAGDNRASQKINIEGWWAGTPHAKIGMSASFEDGQLDFYTRTLAGDGNLLSRMAIDHNGDITMVGDLDVDEDITGENLIATTQVTTPKVQASFTLQLEAGTGIASNTIDGQTTLNPANMVIGGPTPFIRKSTSTKVGKIDVSFLDTLTSNKIIDLQPRIFKSNTSVNIYDDPEKNFIGFYAEEVYEVFPECVLLKNEYPNGLDWNCLNTITIKEVQELKQENQMLKDELCNEHQFWNWCINVFEKSTCDFLQPYSWC